jgi:hypothetical protein
VQDWQTLTGKDQPVNSPIIISSIIVVIKYAVYSIIFVLTQNSIIRMFFGFRKAAGKFSANRIRGNARQDWPFPESSRISLRGIMQVRWTRICTSHASDYA